jgi:hypothetical protein
MLLQDPSKRKAFLIDTFGDEAPDTNPTTSRSLQFVEATLLLRLTELPPS